MQTKSGRTNNRSKGRTHRLSKAVIWYTVQLLQSGQRRSYLVRHWRNRRVQSGRYLWCTGHPEESDGAVPADGASGPCSVHHCWDGWLLVMFCGDPGNWYFRTSLLLSWCRPDKRFLYPCRWCRPAHDGLWII